MNRLAGMPLGPVRRILVNDCYFDTADGTLLEFGYSCRLRESHTGDRTITIKSLTTSSDGLHVREEFEIPLRFGVPIENVHRWPEGVVRDLVADLIHGDRLEELFAFNQERFQRLLPDGEFPQVEVSFDRVSLGGPDAPVLCWVEAELLERGDAAL
ncbi:MAG: CYTH domain-containing protein [Thermomicrobiales bacterium]|nr:CYTH domain-containing protein [Thermomicrobiales bacterium]